MSREEFLKLIKSNLNLDFDVTEDMDMDTLIDDSILIMGLISFFNKYAETKIKFDDFQSFKTVKDILDKGNFK